MIARRMAIICFFVLISCNRIEFKPLYAPSATDFDCSVSQGATGLVSFIEDSLRHHHAESAKPFRIAAHYGSNTKYVTLFKIDNVDLRKQCILLFHFIDRFDDDPIKGSAIFKLDSDSIAKPIIIDPASVIISDVSDQFYFIYLSDSEARELAFSNKVSGRMGLVDFELSFECRNGWRILFTAENK